jgi:beta-N-acetylhexosaminidase
VGFEGDDPAEAVGIAREIRPAGYVLFARNCAGTPARVKAMILEIAKEHLRLLKRPAIMAVDQEGGTVLRLRLEGTVLPSAEEMAAAAREGGPGAIEAMAYTAGVALRELGFNMNLAPVLDVAGEGSYIGSRSFSSDPDEVSRCALAFHVGLKRSGLMGCGKHFPGLGQATVDPHSELPVVSSDTMDVWNRDLKPFRALSQDGVMSMMTTHAMFRAVDPLLPGTLSPRVVDLMKSDLGFKGLALTDDLEMAALAGVYPTGRSAPEAVAAGHDLALVCRGRDNIREARDGLVKAIRDYTLTPARIRDARRRLTKALKRIP